MASLILHKAVVNDELSETRRTWPKQQARLGYGIVRPSSRAVLQPLGYHALRVRERVLAGRAVGGATG
jgi:hypothetical protein